MDALVSRSTAYQSPWRSISQVQSTYATHTWFHVRDWTRVRFWEDTWVGTHHWPPNFLYSPVFLQNAKPNYVTKGRVAWNFHFKWKNLSNMESFNISSLLSTLESIQLLPQLASRSWTLEPSGIYTCKLLFNPIFSLFHIVKVFYKASIPLKINVYSWTP